MSDEKEKEKKLLALLDDAAALASTCNFSGDKITIQAVSDYCTAIRGAVERKSPRKARRKLTPWIPSNETVDKWIATAKGRGLTIDLINSLSKTQVARFIWDKVDGSAYRNVAFLRQSITDRRLG